MKTKIMMLRLAAAAFLCAPLGAIASPLAEAQPETEVIQGVPCQKGRVDLYWGGKLRHAFLSRDFKIGDVVWPSGSEVSFDKAGQIERCWVSRETAIPSGFTLPAGTEVWAFVLGEPRACCLHREAVFKGQQLPLHSSVFLPRQGFPENGWRLWPSKDFTIQGHFCHATDDGTGHMFYHDGQLRAIWVTGVEEIDGVPCTSSTKGMPSAVSFYGTDCMAWFYESGRLQQGMLARDATIQGHAFKMGDIVVFTREGKVDLAAKPLGWDDHGPRYPSWMGGEKIHPDPTPAYAAPRHDKEMLAGILTVLHARAGAGPLGRRPAGDQLPREMKDIDSLRNAGNASAVDAVETVNWAMRHGDIDALAGIIAFDSGGKSASWAFLASLSPEVRAQLQSPQRMMAVLIEYGYPTGRGYRVLADNRLGFAGKERVVRCEAQTSAGDRFRVSYRLQRIDNKWMLEVNERNVSELGRLLAAEKELPPPTEG
jgi:hypothetical protein